MGTSELNLHVYICACVVSLVFFKPKRCAFSILLEIIVLLTTDITEISWYLFPLFLLDFSVWLACRDCGVILQFWERRLRWVWCTLGGRGKLTLKSSLILLCCLVLSSHQRHLFVRLSPTLHFFCTAGLVCSVGEKGTRIPQQVVAGEMEERCVAQSLTSAGLVVLCPTWNKGTGGMLHPTCPPQPAPTTQGQHVTGLQGKLPSGLQPAVRHGLKAQCVVLSAGQGPLRLSRRS